VDQNVTARFEDTMLPHLDAAYGLARLLVRDDHDAEDLVQDAYLRALRHFDGFRGGDPRAWLLTIVRRTCYTWLKRRRTQPPATEFDDEVHSGDIRADDPAALTLDDDLRETLGRAVAGLPIEFREVVLLRDVQGLSYREIAEVVGVPVGTVMSRLARARRRLQATLPVEDFRRS
jgi:RNA polymerase sigma-70 factor (ECF subfamily)